MFGLGFTEVMVILILILLIFGPARLPEIARGLGKGVRQIRRATRDLDTVPEIRELRKAVDEIRSPVMDTLREPVLDPEGEPPPSKPDKPPVPKPEVPAEQDPKDSAPKDPEPES